MRTLLFILVLVLLCVLAFAGSYIGNGLTSIPSSRAYIQNGLVAMWDGIENAGYGIHDSSAATWVDLGQNGFNASQRMTNGWRWDNNGYVGLTGNGHGFSIPSEFTALFNDYRKSHTLEIVSAPVAYTNMTIFGAHSLYRVNFEYVKGSAAGSMRFRIYYNASPDSQIDAATTRTSFSVLSSSSNIKIYSDGVLKSTLSTNGYNVPSSSGTFIIGGENARPARSLDGKIYCIRFYNRVLSEDEVKYNSHIDALRFGQ